MNSFIYLKNIVIYAYHGVSLQETKVGNSFRIDLRVKVDIRQPMETDNVDDTVSYANLYQSVAEEMNIPSKLLEHVAGRMVKRLFREYPLIEAIDLTIAKQNPPMSADIAVAGVELHCDRRSL